MDFNIDEAKLMIVNNKHNQVTATYYLMLMKHIKYGGFSTADLKYYKQQPIHP